MSTGLRVSATEARAVADELLRDLRSSCERIEVAGSLRRGAPDVGDLELVAIPRLRLEHVTVGFFDEQEIEVDELAEEVGLLDARGRLAPHPDRPASGERYQRLLHVGSGLEVDLFEVRPPAQWGVIFLIRTGPAGYSQHVVTMARGRGYHVRDGAIHVGGLGCGAVACEVVPTPEETDVYRVLGLPELPPHLRR